MNSKQRVHAALRKQPVDRVPVFMWFHPDTAHHLAELLEIPPATRRRGDGQRHPPDLGEQQLRHGGHRPRARRRGPRRRLGHPVGQASTRFNQIAQFPLAGAPREAVLAYRFPCEHERGAAGADGPGGCRSADEYFIGCDVSPCVFEMYWRLRGMEEALLDMAADPDLA